MGESAARIDGAEPECRRFLGSGRPVGAVADFPQRGEERSRQYEFHGRGTVVSRAVASRRRRKSIGIVSFGGHDTSREFRENIAGAVLPLLPARRGREAELEGDDFSKPAQTPGSTYATWPPAGTTTTNLYLHANGTLSFTAPDAAEKRAASGAGYREYVSDPANPVPYRARPISPTYPDGTGGCGKSPTSGSWNSGRTC